MNAQAPANLYRPATLADVLKQLARNKFLKPIIRRDLVSAVRTAANLLDRPCEGICADVPKLRAALLAVRPAQRGMTNKTFSNIKSALTKAFEISRAMPRSPPKRDRSAAWMAFLAHADAKHQGWSLSRFVSYCSGWNIEPSQVSNNTLSAFMAHLDDTVLTKEPFAICKGMVLNWNVIIRRNKLKGFQELTPLHAERYIARPLSEYPKSLQADISAYVARLRCEDIFVEDGPGEPVKPRTIRNILAQLRQYLDALISSGRPIESIVSLRDLVDREAIRAAFGQLTRRTG